MNMTTKTQATNTSSVFAQITEHEHEQVVYCYDKESGLKAIIAIHNTVLGPAAGGTRMWAYQNEAAALEDVLRLSRGMTFKNAMAGLNLGGGKAVIIGDARKDKTEVLFRSFGKFVESLHGKYITAEDVGIDTQDMEFVANETKYVAGKPESLGGSGDPSPVTAYGVYMGMKAAAKKLYGKESLEGKKIALQGVGHVGQYLLEHLVKEKAEVFISDYYEDRVQEVASKYGVTGVDKDSIYDIDMDIYAPCALGATVNDDTLERLKCQIIAGAANNQLADEKRHADMCKDKNIVYVPDFLINAGGIINVYYEVINNYNREKVYQHAEKIYTFTENIIETAQTHKINTHEAACQLALQRIEQIGNLKKRM